MSARNSHELKQIRIRLSKAESEAGSIREDIRVAQKRGAEIRKLIVELKQKIERFKGKKPIITEHALLRYFERVLEYNLDSIINGLLTDNAIAMIAEMPNGKIPSLGCRLIVKDGVVVTIET